MTKLASNHAQKAELARRKIAHRLEVVRGRVEVDHGCNLMAQIDKAAIQLHLLNLRDCDDILNRVDERLIQREAERAAAQVANDIGEQSELLASRGVKTEKTGNSFSRDGFVWLEKQKRLSSAQIATGHKIRALHDRATWDGLRSKAGNDNSSPDGSTFLPTEAAMEAKRQIASLREHVVYASGGPGPFDLLMAVCGVGATLRTIAGGDDRRAIVLEGQLIVALEMAEVALRRSNADREPRHAA
jgi:hypothetical protein